MPPVIAAAAAGAAAAAASAAAAGTLLTAATLTAMATSAAISAALAGTMMVLSPKQRPFRQELKDRTVTVRQSVAPRQIIYGEVRTGGPITYMQSTADQNGNNKNKWLHLIIALASHEVESIGDIYFDDQKIPLGADGFVESGKYYFSGDWGGRDPARGTWERGMAYVSKHTGAPGQVANGTLVSSSGGKWTAAHVGQGIAYLYVRLEWNQSIYTAGIPNITAVVRGKKLLDPRDGATRYSTNAALVLRDFLSLSSLEGGLGATADEFDAVNLNAAANLCDEAVPLAEGGTEKRYTINGTVSLSQANSPRNTLEGLLSACSGTVLYSGGKWRILPAAYRTPSVTLNEADVRGGISVTTRVSRRDQFSGIKGTFVSPANNWQPADYPALQSDVVVAELGGEPVWKDVDRPYTTSAATAQRLAKIDLLKARQPITVLLPCKLTAFRVQAGDVINLSLARMGWNAKPFEVVEWRFALGDDGSLGIDLSLRETASSIYDFATSEEETIDPAPGTDLPDWRLVGEPRNLTLNSSASQVLTGGDGSLVSRIVVTWDPPLDGFVSGYEVEWKLTGETEWINRSPATTTLYVIDNMPPGVSVDVRVRALNALGVPSAYVASTGHIVTGTSGLANGALTGLKVLGSTAGNEGTFTTLDAVFVVNPASALGSVLDGYVWEFRNGTTGTGTLRRTITTSDPMVTYLYSDNYRDGLARTFTVSVQAKTKITGSANQLSAKTTLTATNPVPAAPTSVSIVGELKATSVRYTPPTDEDWEGILIWRGTVTGFARNAASLIYDGPDTFVATPGTAGTQYFIRFASYDAFGKVGLVESAEFAVTTVGIVHSDLVGEVVDSTNLLPSLKGRIDLIDAPGTGLVTKVDQVATQSGDAVAAVETMASSVEGLEAQYTVKVEANGYVSGYGLATSSRTGTPTSDFIVMADRFSIAKPGAGGIPATIPFIVKTIGSTPVLSFQGFARFDKLEGGTLSGQILYLGTTNIILDGTGSTIRINDGTRDVVRLGKQLDNSWGASFLAPDGSTIFSTGAGIGAGKVSAAALASGSGVNFAYNADFITSADGWSAGDNSTGQVITIGRNLNAANTIPGIGLLYWSVPNTPASGTAFTINGSGLGGNYAVQAGMRYEAHALMGQYRASYVRIGIRWFNSSGGTIQTDYGSTVNPTTQFIRLDQLRQSLVLATAPVGAVQACLVAWVQCNGGVNPFGMVTQVYFGRAQVNQTEASVWSPGPVPLAAQNVAGLGQLARENSVNWTTQVTNVPAFGGFAYLNGITAANISTYISAAAIGTAYISDLSATKLRAGLVDALDINVRFGALNIIDSNNASATRIKLGHLPNYAYGLYCYDTAGTMQLEVSGVRTRMSGAIIDELSVGTLKIANEAVIVPRSSTTAVVRQGNGAFQQVVSFSFTLAQPARVIFIASLSQSFPSGPKSWIVRGQIYLSNGQAPFVDRNGGAYLDAVSLTFDTVAPAGTHTAALWWQAQDSTVRFNGANVIVLGAMR